MKRIKVYILLGVIFFTVYNFLNLNSTIVASIKRGFSDHLNNDVIGIILRQISLISNSSFLFKSFISLSNLPLFPGVDFYTNYTITRMGLKPLLNIKPIRSGYGSVINDVTSFHYPISTGKCKKKSSIKLLKSKSLFIGIISAPGNFIQRNDIRQTWLLHFKDQQYHRHLIDLIGFGFVIGKTKNKTIQNQIRDEAKTYKDIIQVDMYDGYFKVSKKDAALLNWIRDNCARADFVLKVDDDVYLNIRNLATTIEKISPSRNFIYGLGNAQNITDRGNYLLFYLILKLFRIILAFHFDRTS